MCLNIQPHNEIFAIYHFEFNTFRHMGISHIHFYGFLIPLMIFINFYKLCIITTCDLTIVRRTFSDYLIGLRIRYPGEFVTTRVYSPLPRRSYLLGLGKLFEMDS